ncbi:MAG TPA: hypothetical protein VF552_14915 [Allosphingosinicella sp.]|jgi:hypothetical protein
MISQVIEKAQERLRAIETEAEEIRTFLRVYAALQGDKAVDNESANEESVSSARTASPAEIVDSAKALIRERGRPMTRSQLLKSLRDKGLNLPGKDATKNIGTVIWRSKQFDNIAGEGYWPKEFLRWAGQKMVDPAGPPLA